MKSVSSARRSITFLFVAMAFLGSDLAAQSRTSSAVRGTVRGSNGAPLLNATITLLNVETGTQRSVYTNSAGRYLVLQVQPGGPYTLIGQTLGYREMVREDIILQVGETLTVDLILQDEAVEVQGIEVAVDRTDIFNPSQVGPATRLSERIVESIPILSRNIMELAILSPLVKTTANGGFSIAGQNDRYNSILIDGVLNKDMFGLTAGGVPGGQAGGKLIPLDAVSQYEVLVAPFDVRLSGFTGGVMNAVTRTGTNEWRARGFAVGRTEALIGDLKLPTTSVEASGVDRSLLGLSLGGPLVRNKAHFFIAGEWESRNQPPSGFNVFRDPVGLTRVSESTVQNVTDYFSGFGLDVGDAGPSPLSTDLGNVFARVDWSINNTHRLTIRNIFAKASSDDSPNRAIFDAYEFSSYTSRRKSVNNTTSLQLFSDFGGGSANELTIQVQRTSDHTNPRSAFPSVEIESISSLDGSSVARPLRVGTEFFAQENDLEQTVLRMTNSLTLVNGDNNLVLGVSGAYYDIANRFLPGSTGDYFFASLTDMNLGAPQRYQRSVFAPGVDPTVDFRVTELGAFIQNQMDAGKGLTMRFGLRADVPFVLDRPGENPDILDEFDLNTSNMPSGQILFSPRWGFNWQSEGDRRTQVRGGAGIFVGQVPFVWLSNAFHNDGLRSFTQVCNGRITDDPSPGSAVPGFDPLNAPTACRAAPFQTFRSVVVFAEDFKYPQDLKFSAVVDHEITDRLTLSTGVLFNKALNQIVLEELNLRGPSGNIGDVTGYGGNDRRYFGAPVATGLRPNRELAGYEQVLLARNESEDWGASLTVELKGNLTDRYAMQLGYSLAKSFDRMSLVATDMFSNFGLNATEFDPNSPQLEVSNFDRPHKIVASIYGAPFAGLEDTQISLLYIGQSGAPFSYVYRGDINGDGYPGVGGSFDRFNDLIYVPNQAGEIPTTGPASVGLIAAALDSDECLNRNRGKIIGRNACRSPWQNRLDMRVSQAVHMGGSEIRLEADLINVLNLINGDWGRVESIRSVVPIIEPVSRRQTLSGVGTLQSRWGGTVLSGQGDGGRLIVPDPWSVQTPDSQWQAQFGVRVTFGSGR